MQEAFRLGGWGMYPTAIVGFVLVIAAGRYAWSPTRGRLGFIGALSALAVLTSALGFVTGIIKTTTSAGQLMEPERSGTLVIGFGESLVNVGFGLTLLVLTAIAVTVGLGRRSSNVGRSELVDPHR
jgi:hypothetical protein